MMKKETFFTEAEVIERMIEELEHPYYGKKDSYDGEVVLEVLTSDYYIIGINTARKALEEEGVFEVFEILKDNHYHIEDYTDVETIAAMYWDFIVRMTLDNYDLYDSHDDKTIAEAIEEAKCVLDDIYEIERERKEHWL